jgi:hypothetical protein
VSASPGSFGPSDKNPPVRIELELSADVAARLAVWAQASGRSEEEIAEQLLNASVRVMDPEAPWPADPPDVPQTSDG